MIDYPLWPVGLNLSYSEPLAASRMAMTNNPFLTPDCQAALGLLICASKFSYCNLFNVKGGFKDYIHHVLRIPITP